MTIRDALWAAANRAKNTAQFAESHQKIVQADIFQIKQLLNQCQIVAPEAIKDGDLSETKWQTISNILHEVEKNLVAQEIALNNAATLLTQAVTLIEKKS